MTKTTKSTKSTKSTKIEKMTKTTKKGGKIEKSIFFENKSCIKNIYNVYFSINQTKIEQLFVCSNFVRKIKKMYMFYITMYMFYIHKFFFSKIDFRV